MYGLCDPVTAKKVSVDSLAMRAIPPQPADPVECTAELVTIDGSRWFGSRVAQRGGIPDHAAASRAVRKSSTMPRQVSSSRSAIAPFDVSIQHLARSAHARLIQQPF